MPGHRYSALRDAIRRIVAFLLTVCVVLACLLLVMTFTPVVPSLATRMATDWYDGNGDVLVILGGSMLVPGTGPRAALGYDSYLRTVYASWVLQNARYRKVVTSGSSGLAENMAAFLVAHGVPSEMILIENRSTSTAENAAFTKDLLARHNLLKPSLIVAILTSDYHSWRAQKCFAKIGLPVRVIPVPDIAKRSGALTFRWTGSFMLLQEWGKDVAYGISGKI